MRQVTVFFLLGLLFASNLVNAVNLRSDSTAQIYNRLKEIKNTGIEFAEHLVQMVEMKLMTSDQVSDIQETLQQLGQELKNKLSEVYTNYVNLDQAYTNKISQLDARIAELGSNLDTLALEIADLTQKITSDTSRKNELSAALKVAQDHLVSLRAVREQDVNKYNTRVENTNAIIEALRTIVDKLQGLLNGTVNLAEVKTALKQVDPLILFVQMTATMSPEDINNVLGKLNQILNSMEQSLVDDAKFEETATQNFKIVESEFEKTIDDFNSEIKGLERNIEDNTSLRNNKQAEYDSKTKEKADKEIERSDNLQRKAENQRDYERQNEKISKEIELVDQVVTIFKNNSDKFRNLLARGTF